QKAAAMVVVDEGGEHQRPHPGNAAGLVDLSYDVAHLIIRVHERKCGHVEIDVGELRQQAVAHHFRGNPGSVGYHEYGSTAHRAQHYGSRPAGEAASRRGPYSTSLRTPTCRQYTGIAPRVGGKNASLGEMISALADSGIEVPGGFATTADAYRRHLARDGLDKRIAGVLDALDVDDVSALTAAGRQIRQWIEDAPLPEDLENEIREAYRTLGDGRDAAVAVRSSATAEDLPEASFAGQQETFLNVCGADAVLAATRRVFASLFNDRAISYRVHQGFTHDDVALSAGIQYMVRSDIGSSGVMFTLDT